MRARGTEERRASISAVVLAISISLVACKDTAPKATPPPPPTPAAPVTPAPVVNRGSVTRADLRVELVSIICRLAGYNEYTRAKNTPYLDAVDKWFGEYAKHPAVIAMRELRARQGISFDAPMSFAVHLDDEFQVVHGEELAQMDERWKGVDVAALARLVKAFAGESRIAMFRAEQTDYYAKLHAPIEEAIAKERASDWFDGVFGPAEGSFVVVPSPIAGTMNFGPRATGADGKLHMYQVLGISSKTGEAEIDEQFIALLVHEMAHSYINPVFDAHRTELAKAGEVIMPLVEKQMRAQAYPDWQTVVNESGVRAIVVNYMREKHGPEAGARTARAEQRSGFLWINELAEVMRQIGKTGDQDLDKHVPKIVAFFDELASTYSASGLPLMPFRGPVDAVHHRDPVWVVPDDKAVAGYARMIHTQLKKTGAIVTASATTLREQKGRDLVAYGTPKDNPVIDFVARSARWKISKDSIVLGDKQFTGPGLVLIACWYLRDDPSRGVAVYTAPESANLVGINSVRHGPNDWLVARKQGAAFAILGAGDFPRGLDDMWMLPGETPYPENPK